MMRIAVASKGGKEVDQHFGHAERFLIYEVTPDSLELVDEVEVDKYCSFNPEQPMRHGLFAAILESLQGCTAVMTAQIGDYPRQELEKAGLRHVRATGGIEQAVRAAHDAMSQVGCH